MKPTLSAPPATTTWRTRLVRADTSARWDGGRWTSAPLSPGWGDGAGADQAVVSWNLDAGARAAVEIRARVDAGWGPWHRLARWGDVGDRSSAGGGERAAGEGPAVDTDILTAGAQGRFDAVQLRITLDGREQRGGSRPLRLAAVSFSAPADTVAGADALESAGRADADPAGAVAALRPLSQRAYPARTDLGGGGPAWCSPTSLTMVALAWGSSIPAAPPADVPDGADPRVPWVARAVYDAAYDGTGNWSFNAALAGALGFDAVVTRLTSIRSAQRLTDAGIPLIASISFGAGELAGADYDTGGHLLVIRGVDGNGDVLVADPANTGGDDGLRTYPRAAFDRAWSRSRRTVYLITPRGYALPADGAGEW